MILVRYLEKIDFGYWVRKRNIDWRSEILRTDAQAFFCYVYNGQERAYCYRRWLDTVLVLAVNYADRGLEIFSLKFS